MRVVVSPTPSDFDRTLPALTLEGGAFLASPRVRGWMWGPEEDHAAVLEGRRVVASLPTVVMFPPLTADARAGGPGGYWEPLVGPGRALRPWTHRLLSFAPLGSCHGTSGPLESTFPRRRDDTRFPAAPYLARGAIPVDEDWLPATVTPWDQARVTMSALDALGVEKVALVAGGSLGGMVALALAVLAPDRVERVLSVAAPLAATPWMIAWNHLAREALLHAARGGDLRAGLSVARQIGRLSYRAEPSLELRQGRRTAGDPQHGDPPWSPRTPYRVETYLRHHGDDFAARFDPRAYLCLLGAMDHHDLARCPLDPPPPGPWGLARLRAAVLNVRIDTDQLVSSSSSAQLSCALHGAGVHVEDATLSSVHGHDAFLIEWTQLGALVRRALALPAPNDDGTQPQHRG